MFRGSWFRTGYELLYAPISAPEKRAAKSVIDVGADRLGDAVGGTLVRATVAFVPAAQSSTILAIAIIASIGALIASSQLNRWYLRTLETSLVKRGGRLRMPEVSDDFTRRVILHVRGGHRTDPRSAATKRTGVNPIEPDPTPSDDDWAIRRLAIDSELQDLFALRTRDRARAIEVLSRDEGISASLVAEVIPLLAEDQLADYAVFSLRKVAEERIGQLVDALLDPNQDEHIRRQLARVLSVCVSQRAADGLIAALDDERFEVRFQAARSLRAVADRNPRVRIDRDQVFAVIRRELALQRPLWESRRLLDKLVTGANTSTVRRRAGQSLEHVFSLLSLVLPAEPVQVAFRSLDGGDDHLRGTALEYLEGVLPEEVRQGLWPWLLLRAAGPATVQTFDRVHHSQAAAGFGIA
jgi:hypothetical protein